MINLLILLSGLLILILVPSGNASIFDLKGLLGQATPTPTPTP